MGKGEPFQDLALLPARGGQLLWQWLYTELRSAIREGRLKVGTRLPSTRSLAKQYGLSRGTVSVAFDQLQSEGYTETQTGSGTFVAGGRPDTTPEPRGPAANLPRSTAGLSRRGASMVEGVRVLPASRQVGRAFRMYEPAVELFPVNLWARVAGRVLRRAPHSMYAQGHACGFEPLRKAIAEYVGAARGVRCSAAQIVVTSGAQQGLDLVARLLLDPGDQVWVEDPCYFGARLAFRGVGAIPVPVPVDQKGLNVEEGRRLAPQAKLAYVTPSNQFPLGITMRAERRLALLQWAVNANAWVIEDEYDAEYRYEGRPTPAMQSLDASGCVVYVGTFTKMLFNALRLGFLVVPDRLVGAFEAARSLMDRHPPTLDQAILAEFIEEGHFGHHVRRMRQLYKERSAVLRDAAREHLGEWLEVQPAVAGMRTVGWLKPGLEEAAVVDRGRALGLEVSGLSEFTLQQGRPAALLLGFAGCSPDELRRGVLVMRSAFV